jgi:hypothetical protein
MFALPPQKALEDAKAMLLQNILDSKKAHVLQLALRMQSIEAHESGRHDDALKLKLVADDLGTRFPPRDNVELATVATEKPA